MSLSAPWNLIKADYLSGVSIPDLAKKYGIKFSTIEGRAARSWRKEKKAIDAETSRIIREFNENLVIRQLQARTEAVQLADQNLEAIQSLKSIYGSQPGVMAMLISSEALAVKLKRQALDIPEPSRKDDKENSRTIILEFSKSEEGL